MPGSLTTPGRPGARDDAPGRVAFRYLHGVGIRNRTLSRLNGWPMRPPVNASPKPSRAAAHDSGPMWIATPSSQRTCTLYSFPVSRRFENVVRNSLSSGHQDRRVGSRVEILCTRMIMLRDPFLSLPSCVGNRRKF